MSMTLTKRHPQDTTLCLLIGKLFPNFKMRVAYKTESSGQQLEWLQKHLSLEVRGGPELE